MDTDSKDKVREILGDFSTAMLVTHSEEAGSFSHARPMEVASVDENCDVWFFTGRDSPKLDEIKHDKRVLLTFQRDHKLYLTLSGEAEIVYDRSRISELWKEPFKVWFPGGVDDPSLTLVRVRAKQAEYWDNSGLEGVRYLFSAVKAYVTGKTPEIKEGSVHGEAAFV
jgi:general stress protein 26